MKNIVLNTKIPVYSGLGTYTLSLRIPTNEPFDLLVNYGKGTLTYVDASRLEATVNLKTPYGDGGAYVVLLSPEWRMKKDKLSYANTGASRFTVECIGDSYVAADRAQFSYVTFGYIVR